MDVKFKLKAFNSKVFKAYDIRGLYPEELDSNNLELIALGFVEFLKLRGKGNLLLLGQDVRWSSYEIREIIRETLLERGVEILDAGVLTTPMFTFAIKEGGAEGGIMITASHNSIRYNGLKLYDGLLTVSERTGLKDIKDIIGAGLPPYSGPKGNFQEKDFKSGYADFLESRISLKRKIKTVFDAGGGAIGIILPRIVEKLKLDAITLFPNPDPSLSVREPNPLLLEAQLKAREALLANKAELGFIFDPDGDRLVVLDENGKVQRGDAILWLLASHLARPGDMIVYDIRSSRALREDLEAQGIRGDKSRVGRSFINELMRSEDAILGGELSGHFFFKEFFFSDSALLAALKILEILSKSQKPLSEHLSPYLRYFHSGDINFYAKDKEKIIEAIEAKYRGGLTNYLDGLTVEYPTFWFNLRASNTEDLLRLVLEANDKNTFEARKKEIFDIMLGVGARLA